MKKIIITGGNGFIGRSIIKNLLTKGYEILNIDKITYASKKSKFNIKNKNYKFFKKDILNTNFLIDTFNSFKPDCLLNVAAESHVDNSILNSKKFIKTNIEGTANLLDCSKNYIQKYPIKKKKFIFFQISTDEVYGDIDKAKKSKETDILNPSSPYSASKASADLLVKSWSRTYGINYLISRSSNNFGPYQHKEKFIPVIIKSILKKKNIPIYGNGEQKREWIFVEDCADAITTILKKGKNNSTYNLGSGIYKSNIRLASDVCLIYDKLINNDSDSSELFDFVTDRLGHDKRYALNIIKIQKELKWKVKTDYFEGLKKTIKWYLLNKWFLE